MMPDLSMFLSAPRWSCRLAALVAIGALSWSASFAQNWPEFRGPTGQGIAEDAIVPTRWSESEHVRWKTKIPGTGWSSPVIWRDQIWLTTAIPSTATEEEVKARIAALNAEDRASQLHVAGKLQLRAIGIDRETGKILHDVLLFSEANPEPINAMNSYASPTPVIEEGRVYCHFGTYGTAAVDTESGKILWTNSDLKINHENGAGSSPTLWNSFLIVHCDGSDTQSIAAIDKHTGKLAWRTSRSGFMQENPQFKKAYGTPLVVKFNGHEYVISGAADWLYAYDPATGREEWKIAYGFLGFSNVPRPVTRDGVLYICTGFMKSQLLAIASGFDDEPMPEIKWSFNKQVPQISSPLLIEENLYFVSDQGGIFSAVNAETGELVFQERLGGDHAASPIYAGGNIYLCDREGTTHVIKPGSTFAPIEKNTLDDGILASPAALDNALYLRTETALYRIE
jgi:outer membrane protein assembly factor BamB